MNDVQAESFWHAIATTRDAYPRSANDAPTDEILEAIKPHVERLVVDAEQEATARERERIATELDAVPIRDATGFALFFGPADAARLVRGLTA